MGDNIKSVVENCYSEGKGLIPTLQAIQDTAGYIPLSSIGTISEVFGISESSIYGTITFYSDLYTEKGGRHTIRVCCGESCYAKGSTKLLIDISKLLKVKCGETTKDGKLKLDIAYCLGNCALSPSLMVDKKVYGKVDKKRAANIIKRYKNVE